MGNYLDERIEEFLKAKDASPRTRETYRVGLREFLGFQAQKQHRRPLLTNLGADVLEGFQNWLNSKDLARLSRRTYIAAVVAFLSYALAQDWLPDNFPMEKAKAKLKLVQTRGTYPIKKVDPRLGQVITYYQNLPLPSLDDPKNHLPRLRQLRDAALCWVFYCSGGRLSEVRALNQADFLHGEREVIIRGKGDSPRTLYLSPEALTAIRSYLTERADAYEPLFIRHDGRAGSRLSDAMIQLVVGRAANAVGIQASPHDFRHHLASRLLDQDVPLEQIQELLGHSDISTTRKVYARYSQAKLRELAAKAESSLRSEQP